MKKACKLSIKKTFNRNNMRSIDDKLWNAVPNFNNAADERICSTVLSVVYLGNVFFISSCDYKIITYKFKLISTRLQTILYIVTRSALSRLSSSVSVSSSFSLCKYGILQKPSNVLVNFLRTASILSLMFIKLGDRISLQHSRVGLTYVTKALNSSLEL